MTFDEIVTEIKDRLNLTSTEASTRIGRIVNRYHRKVCAAVNVAHVSKRVLGATKVVTIGNAEVTFSSMEKVTRVWYGADTSKVFLDERTLDELRDEIDVSGDTPSRWAPLSTLGDGTTTILIDMEPATAYTLKADGYTSTATLAGSNTPRFAEPFHDILVEGPLKDEYKKLKQKALADDSKLEYERLLSDLKFHNAKSAYLKIQQNGRPRGQRFRRDDLVT